MFVTRHGLKQRILYQGDTYVVGRVFAFVWRWQVADRLGGFGGLAFGKNQAKSAARNALRSRSRPEAPGGRN